MERCFKLVAFGTKISARQLLLHFLINNLSQSLWILHVSLFQLSERKSNLISQKLLKRLAEDDVYGEDWAIADSVMYPPSNILNASTLWMHLAAY